MAPALTACSPANNRIADLHAAPVEWAVSPAAIDYPPAVEAMEARVAAIAAGTARELVWLTAHPPLYTAGTSARAEDLLTPDRFPVYRTGRGGQYTYHGPGQRVVYVMLDVRRRAGDVKQFVTALEDWTIATLAELGVTGETRCGRVGVWVRRAHPALLGATADATAGASLIKHPDMARNGSQPAGEDKIAAIGIRLRRWISFHGLAINVDPDLSHFDGIVPCGIREHGVTSLARLVGQAGSGRIVVGSSDDAGPGNLADDLDRALRATFEQRLGATIDADAPY